MSKSKKEKQIPDIVIERLPRYYRYLRQLRGHKEKVSSSELARSLATSASQVRLDLSYFGGFGLQGYGYNVEDLYQRIGCILGVDRPRRYLIIGAGSLGRAIARYPVFLEVGFELSALFDVDPEIIGSQYNGVTVEHIDRLEERLAGRDVEIAVLTVPAEAARQAAERAIAAGVRGVLNFAPCDLELPDGIPVKNIHLTDRLLALSYWISNDPNCRGTKKNSEQQSKKQFKN